MGGVFARERQQAGSAACRVPSGLSYGDPPLLRLLLLVSLAFAAPSFSLPEGWVRAMERSPPLCCAAGPSAGWSVEERLASWARLGFRNSLNLEGASVPRRFSPGEIGLGFLVQVNG